MRVILRSKATRAIFALNRSKATRAIVAQKFHNLLVDMALKRFDSLILLILLCGSEVWNPYRGYNFSTWDKTEVKRVPLQFLKRLGVLKHFH